MIVRESYKSPEVVAALLPERCYFLPPASCLFTASRKAKTQLMLELLLARTTRILNTTQYNGKPNGRIEWRRLLELES